MTSRHMAATLLAVTLVVPASAWAHQGHVHSYRGTVAAVHEGSVEIRTTDGNTLTFVLDAKTIYQRGKTRVDAKTLIVGERVVVAALPVDAGKTMTAQTVQLPAIAVRR